MVAFGMPAPPEVVGQFPQAAEVISKALLDGK